MSKTRIMGVLGLALLVFAGMQPAPVAAQSRVEGAGNPILLGRSNVGTAAGPLSFANLAQRGRMTAVRLQIDSGDCVIERVVIAYASGQVHYEVRDIALNERGRRTALIDPRVDARLIDNIQVQVKANACQAGIALEVEGMQPPRARSFAIQSTPTAAQPRTPRSTTSDDASSPAPSASRVPQSGSPPPAAEPPKPFTEVAVYYGTSREAAPDRQREDVKLASYGPGPSADGKLSLGQAVVTVPNEGRKPGEINRPQLSILSFGREDEDKSRHFTIYRVDQLNEAELKATIRFAKKPVGGRFKDHAFVFVHGYNMSFDDALFRGAQLAFDMDFDGLPFVFSWPSRSNAAGYVLDKDRAFDARHALGSFIKIVQQVMGNNAKNIHFIGHSMGTLPLMEALSTIEPAATSGPVFGQVIFAASDVVPDSFRNATSRIARAASAVTLYASNNDWALTISRAFRLGIPPVGLVPASGVPFMAPGFESVDVSELDTSFWARNHSTYGDRKPLIEDMSNLFVETAHLPPDQRDKNFQLQSLPRDTGRYWRYAKP